MALGLVASCHDCSEGGLAVALGESAFAGGLGAQIDLRKMVLSADAKRDDAALFSESAGRFVVSVSAKRAKEFEALMQKQGARFAGVGVVKGKNLVISGLNGKKIVDAKIEELRESWKSRHWF